MLKKNYYEGYKMQCILIKVVSTNSSIIEKTKK